jgi:photosystem II stability/assembly factor-like uncharacterized protein
MYLAAMIAVLRMTSSTSGTAILDDGTVETTTDGGKTYSTVAPRPGKVPALLDDGRLVWFRQGRACDQDFAPTVVVSARRAFAFACVETSMAAQQMAELLETSDAGATWKVRAIAEPDRGTLRYVGYKEGLMFFDAHHGIAFGETEWNALWADETFDGGATWKPSKAFFAQHGRVHVVAGLRPLAQVLSSGTAVFALPFHDGGGVETDIFVTRDRGATWTEIDPLDQLASIQILDAKHLVALCADGRIFRWDGVEWTASGKLAEGQRIWFRTYDEGWIIKGAAITRWSP